MEQIKLGVIGCGGGIATKHINNVVEGKCPNVRITAVSNRTVSKAYDTAKRLEEKGIHVDVFETDSDLIQNADVDAVLIATPHYYHEALGTEAFEKGLHVLSEKPLGAYTAQAKRLIAAADSADKVFGIVFQHRTYPVNKKVREIVKSGVLGDIRRINWISTDSYRGQKHYDVSDWRGTWDRDGGGTLLNQAPHRLDLIQWIFGMPAKVTGFLGLGKWHDIEGEDDVTAFMEYESGTSCVFIASTSDGVGTNRLEITANNGKLVAENNTITFYHFEQGLTEYTQNDPEGKRPPAVVEIENIPVEGETTAQAGILQSFAEEILFGTPQIADGHDGDLSLMLANAMIMSQWNNNCTITLPIDDDEYLKQLQAHYTR